MVLFLLYRKFRRNFLIKQKAPHGCAARGEEISCFATPLAREEFANELFILPMDIIGKMCINNGVTEKLKRKGVRDYDRD